MLGDLSRERRMAQGVQDARRVAEPYDFEPGVEEFSSILSTAMFDGAEASTRAPWRRTVA